MLSKHLCNHKSENIPDTQSPSPCPTGAPF